jgi:peptidyl-prolyl cis-trans isomerase SurA
MYIKRLAPITALIVFGLSGIPGADILEQVLVKVNGDIFTKTELEARQVSILRQRGQNPGDAELKKAIAEITPAILIDTIDEMLLVQRGRELGYRLTDDQFKEVLDRIKKENKIENEEQFQAALKQEGMTMPDLRRQLERQMIVSRVQQSEVLGKVGITEDEAKKYYEEHVNEFTTPAALTLREILIEVPTDGKTVNVGRDEEAKEKAEAALQRIRKGEPFEKVAAEVSDSPSKANGGQVGPVTREELTPQFRQLLGPLKAGQISSIIRTPRGYHFLMVESATEAVSLPFDKAREQIADRIFNDKRRVEMEKYIQKLRAEAIIEWKNDDLKNLYERAVAAAAVEKPAA